jgi:hypothetical protein
LIKVPTTNNPAKVQEIKAKAYAEYDAGKITLTERNKMLDETNNYAGKDFQSSHRDEPNVISHLRLNERTYQGKKVTFMEELQSDWAREGRQRGFTDPQKSIEAKVFEDDLRSKYNLSKDELIINNDKVPREEQLKLSGLNIAKTSGTPNNPLLKDRQELSIKRALKEAVDNNSEYFAWIN